MTEDHMPTRALARLSPPPGGGQRLRAALLAQELARERPRRGWGVPLAAAFACLCVLAAVLALRPGPTDGGIQDALNAQINLEFANGVVGHLTGSYDANPRHNLERCEVMGTKGRFVLDNLYEELTLYPRDSEELTVIRNSIMGGLSGFGATFTNRIHRWLEQVSASVPRDQLEASGHEGLAVQEIIEAAIKSHHSGRAEPVHKLETVTA